MTDEKDLRIGMEVTVSSASKYYGDWLDQETGHPIICVITGLDQRCKDSKINITIVEKSDYEKGECRCDGWKAKDLDSVEGAYARYPKDPRCTAKVVSYGDRPYYDQMDGQ